MNAERSWLESIKDCVVRLRKKEFTLDDMYEFEPELSNTYPNNNFVRDNIRQQLQVLRDGGYLEFTEPGTYRVRDSTE